MSDPLAKMLRLQRILQHEKRKEEYRQKQQEEQMRRREGYSWNKTVPNKTSPSPSSLRVASSLSTSASNRSLKPHGDHRDKETPSPKTRTASSEKVASTTSHRKTPRQSILRSIPNAKRKLEMENTFTPIDEKWLDKPAAKRKKEPESKNPAAVTKTKPARTPKAQRKPTYDDSSDEDFDLLAHFRKIRGMSGPDNEDKSDPKETAEKEETISPSPHKRNHSLNDSSSEEEEEIPVRSKQGSNNRQRRSLDKSLMEDSMDEAETNNHRKRAVKNSGNNNNKSLMDDSSDDEMPSPRKYIANSDDENDEKAKKTKAVLNPITLEQQQLSIAATAALKSPPTKAGNNDDRDDLWGDSDGDPQKDESDEETKKPRGRSKKSKKSSKSKIGKSGATSSSPSRHQSAATDFSGGGSKYWYLRNEDDHDIKQLLKSNDEEKLELLLHPELENPFFGPFELEPFVLGGDTETTHSVPASLSRYLAPYQREGIQFMHKCLTSSQGSIMGDEMGLGKTVQVIALLCALFEKTGTGLDFLKIKHRNEVIARERKAAEIERDKALLEGRLGVKEAIGRSNLNLSPWYPVLIIVPPSVVDNWKNEFATFSNFAVAVYSGDKRFRDMELEKLRDGRAEVLIVAKSMFQSRSSFQPLDTIRWKLVVVDEFHTFKNGSGHLSEHLRELKAKHRSLVLGMTGTLMQNDHKELWNLIDLVETDYLGSWEEFNGDTAHAIKHGRQKDANQATIDRSSQKVSALKKKLSKILIERKKDEVLGDLLTNKRQDVVLCPPSELQKRVYEHIMTLPDVQLVKMANSPCDCGINQAIYKKYYKLKTAAERVRYIREHQSQIVPRKGCCYRVPHNPRQNEPGQPVIDPDAVLWRLLDSHDKTDQSDEGCDRCPYCVMFPILNKLNKLCSHVGSLQAEQRYGSNQKGSEEHLQFMKELEFAKVALPPDVVSRIPGGLIRNDTIMDKHFELSGKLKKLDQLLSTFAKDDSKVLLFSYSTKTLDFIQNYVRSRGFSHLRIDGSVKAKNRQDLCNKFNNDPSIFLFLLSTKACGLGLNLTSANKVIIFDVEWNPSWDDQAQDRAYRIGQKRDVRVIRLIAEGTVDELKYLRQLYKVQLKDETLGSNDNSKAKAARLFRAVQGEKHRKGELFGAENLLKFKGDGSFLSDVWKSKKSKDHERQSSGVEIHEGRDLSGQLSKNRCGELFDSDPTAEMFAGFESQTSQNEWLSTAHASSRSKSSSQVGAEVQEADSEALESRNGKIFNQEDLMRADRGAAAIEAGEEGYEEEMGGQTQNAYAAFAALSDQARDVEDAQDRHGESERYNPSHLVRDDDAVQLQQDGGEDNNGNEDDDVNLLGNAVNHQDLFNEEEGGAAYEQGDDGYDEEMGGGTQNAYASYENMQLPENPQDAMDEEEVDNDPDVSRGTHLNPAVNGRGIQGVDRPHGDLLNPRNDGQLVGGGVNERSENERQRPEDESFHHSQQDSDDYRALQRSPMEAAEEKSSFFYSRQVRERRDIHSTVPRMDAPTRPDGNTRAETAAVARAANPNDIATATAAGNANEPRVETHVPKKKKKDPAKRPAIALMGKTSSEIAKNANFGIQLPSYKRKRRKK